MDKEIKETVHKTFEDFVKAISGSKFSVRYETRGDVLMKKIDGKNWMVPSEIATVSAASGLGEIHVFHQIFDGFDRPHPFVAYLNLCGHAVSVGRWTKDELQKVLSFPRS